MALSGRAAERTTDKIFFGRLGPSSIYFSGLILLYVGERIIGVGWWSSGCDIIGSAAILYALIGRLYRRATRPANDRYRQNRLLIYYLIGIGALLLYVLQTDFVVDELQSWGLSPRSSELFSGSLAVLWPLALSFCIAPVVFFEACPPPPDGKVPSSRAKLQRSENAALLIVINAALVFLLNYIVNEFNRKIDLSYFQVTRPSEASKKMVADLSDPFEVRLFFSLSSDVAAPIKSFFSELTPLSTYFSVEELDHVLHPDLAKKLSVTSNGTIILSRGKQHERIRIGESIRKARSRLRRFDGDFQRGFLRLARRRRVAYFTVGHEEKERKLNRASRQKSISDMSGTLEELNYDIRDLGLAEGLGGTIPEDADLVLIVGPRKPFLEVESNAIGNYLRSGGAAMILLDPEAGLEMKELLAPTKLRFVPQELANSREHYRLTGTVADRIILLSNNYKSHGSTNTLRRFSRMLSTLLIGAGYLTATEGDSANYADHTYTLDSMRGTWNDINRNRRFDKNSEEFKIYHLAAAISGKINKRNKPLKDTEPRLERANEGMRAIVIGDSDLFSDIAFRNRGNSLLFVDSIRWLGGEERFVGAPARQRDIKIYHTRKQDQFWFYLTIFAAPIMVLSFGLIFVRLRRSR